MPKTAIITGSSRGIGEAMASELLSRDYNVTIFCRHQDHVADARARLLEKGAGDGQILPLSGDVRDVMDVRKIVTETVSRFGSVDVLINNAGIAVWKRLVETVDDEIDEVIDTNLKGAILFAREVIPFMKRGSVIINTSSVLGVNGSAKYSAYCASKFGMIGLTEVLADELAKSGIKVYSLLPGGVATKLHFDIHPWESPDDMMTPEHIAKKAMTLLTGDKPSGSALKVVR